jgi:hypothetical protein
MSQRANYFVLRAYAWSLACFLHCCICSHNDVGFLEITVMDIKLALLFLFVSAMITLSHLDDENVERIKQQLRCRQWREFRLWRTKVCASSRLSK